MLRCVLLASVVIKHICTKTLKSWMLFFSHLRLDPPQPLSYPNHSAYSWSRCTPLSFQISSGLRVQGTANRPAPPPMIWPLAPTATTSSKQMGNGWPKPALCSPPHVKCGISAIYTPHPLQTLAKWLFPYIGLTASQLCALSKLVRFLDF